MRLTSIASAQRHGFSPRALHQRRDVPHATILFLQQRSTFLIAILSILAFFAGNMVGEHGWYAFWKAALGNDPDSTIVFTGTVGPVERVPNYGTWSASTTQGITFRDVPQSQLIELPTYRITTATDTPVTDGRAVYSVDYMGSYDTGRAGEGSHPGIDIRMPVGTPVHSIANGIVESVREDPGGYGKLIVIRHPNAPDVDAPERKVKLYSSYAHLSSQLVVQGQVVSRGQTIALSGQTGAATGPHLHFQIDRSDAPFHPYWPFTGTEARAAGLSMTKAVDQRFMQDRGYRYTINPMLYVTRNTQGLVAIASASSQKTSTNASSRRSLSLADQRAKRLADRVTVRGSAPLSTSPVVQTTVVADARATVAALPQKTPGPLTLRLVSESTFAPRTWINLRIEAVDATGTVQKDVSGLPAQLYLRTAYGEADFDPPIIKREAFVDGSVTIKFLPRGDRTVVPLVQPLGVMGRAVTPERN